MVPRSLLLAILVSSASAVKLYVTAWGSGTANGSVTTLDFDTKSKKLSTKAVTQLGDQPTWFEFFPNTTSKAVILDESWGKDNGSIYTTTIKSDRFIVAKNGLNQTQGGPVASLFYNDGQSLAVANYNGGSLQAYDVSESGSFKLRQTFAYGPNLNATNSAQQSGSRVHHVALDPKGEHIVAPDLANDVVHVFRIDKANGGSLKALPDISVGFESGAGPRHATFYQEGPKTFLFIIQELKSLINVYEVTYPKNVISFKYIQTVSSFGALGRFPDAAASEIAARGGFVYGSNRKHYINDQDTIIVYQLDARTGKLTEKQLVPTGGKEPRHFSISKDGKWIAVANTASPNVAILERDDKTGLIGKVVASVPVGEGGSGVTKATWAQ